MRTTDRLSRTEKAKKLISTSEAKIQNILAVDRKLQRTTAKKAETRRKILLGVMMQGMIKSGGYSAATFDEMLNDYFGNDNDRELCREYFAECSQKLENVWSILPIDKSFMLRSEDERLSWDGRLV